MKNRIEQKWLEVLKQFADGYWDNEIEQAHDLFDTPYPPKDDKDYIKKTTFLDNATIKFPLPEASSEILGNIQDNLDTLNPELYVQIKTRLQKIGFQEANANALSIVLYRVAENLNINPLEFFSINENTL